jgi:hypothetical protein
LLSLAYSLLAKDLTIACYAVECDRPRWVLLYVRGSSIFDDAEELETQAFAGDASPELAQQLCHFLRRTFVGDFELARGIRRAIFLRPDWTKEYERFFGLQ